MQLKKKFTEEELTWEHFWVNSRTSVPWTVNSDNVPIDAQKKPIALLADGSAMKDITDGPHPEKISIGLKIILDDEASKINKVVYEMQTTARKGDKEPALQTNMDMTKWRKGRLEASIVAWKGITDAGDATIKPSPENIGMLPAWITDRLNDIIADMSSLPEDLVGE